MKIATWNLQRLDKRKNAQILDKLAEVSADICVLTETNLSIQLANYTCLSTNILPAHFDGIKYKNGECRVSILTHYKVIAQHTTFDSNTLFTYQNGLLFCLCYGRLFNVRSVELPLVITCRQLCEGWEIEALKFNLALLLNRSTTDEFCTSPPALAKLLVSSSHCFFGSRSTFCFSKSIFLSIVVFWSMTFSS